MKILQLLAAISLAAATTLSVQADSPVPGTVADLSWMTGSWAGPIGEQTLEENWIQPTDGSIAALVRSTGNGATGMVELIVIEEEANTLVLRVQQWNPGFDPRTPGPQKMLLSELGKQRVKFVATGEGGMKSLGYSRPDQDSFTISVETATGAKFDIPLSAR